MPAELLMLRGWRGTGAVAEIRVEHRGVRLRWKDGVVKPGTGGELSHGSGNEAAGDTGQEADGCIRPLILGCFFK